MDTLPSHAKGLYMSRYIQSVSVPGLDKQLTFHVPNGEKKSAINVLCGENYTGKSYLLSKIRQMYASNKADMYGLRIEYVDEGKERNLPVYFKKPWDLKKKAGGYSFGTKKSIPLSDGPPVYEYLLRFCYETIFVGINKNISIDAFSDPCNTVDRYTLFAQAHIYPDERMFYPCPAGHPLVQQLERILKNKRLYYRFVKIGGEDAPTDPARFELLLIDAENRPVSFDKWSDGQQIIFLLLLTLQYQQTDLILLDEIENHLHPSYMSSVLEILKECPAQSIIVTHHPHVIFSRYPDCLFYITNEDSPFMDDARPVISINHDLDSMAKAFRRNVASLVDDGVKIASAYALFDERDNHLMRLSKHMARSVEVNIYCALSRLVKANEPVRASRKSLPDTQTERLFTAASQQFKRAKGLKILDIGAGYGRVMEELRKASGINQQIEWYLLNLDEAQARAAAALYHADAQVHSITDYAQVPDGSMDIAVVANVIHEITPPQFAKLLIQSQKKLSRDGLLLIVEMDPLLHPEKYAVSYNYGELATLLGSLGWNSAPYCVNYKTVNLYCVASKKTEKAELDAARIVSTIEICWREKRTAHLRAYGFQGDGFDFDGYLQTTQTLTSVMSICSYFDGIWT